MSDTPPYTTSDAGIPATSDEHSLTVGPDGPILLQDTYLVQKMQQFNRERVPERVVHAKGGGAHGFFETTEDVSAFTKAALFQPGVRTDLLVRFSTVAGELGSPDTVRDPRGFAIKFYTEHGNYDMVGNNTPVFFIRDPQKFQDFIHSQKRRADNHLRDNNMQWDFWTLSPESAHQVTVLMGDRGIPRSWRHMDGFSSHTYMWINAGGERFWVKYHFKTDQGNEFLTNDEAAAIAAADPDAHIRDLYETIGRGDHPSLDRCSSRSCPSTTPPDTGSTPSTSRRCGRTATTRSIRVGRMVLDRNPENYFAEIEQSTFEPSNMVPGIGPSPDKMLLGRLFSYHDTHLHRVGANAQQLPVNRPRSPVHSYNRDGHMRYENPPDPVYAPNSYGGPKAQPERFGADPSWAVVRRDRPGRLRAARRGRRLRPGRHPGPRRARRRRPGPAGGQRRHPRARRSRRARALTGEGVLAPGRSRPRGPHRQGARNLRPGVPASPRDPDAVFVSSGTAP